MNSFLQTQPMVLNRGGSLAKGGSGLLRRCRSGLVGGAIGLMMLQAGNSRAETITLQPVADTSLFEVSPGGNLGSSTHIPIGAVGPGGGGKRGRGLFRFDPSQIPANSTILSAALTLRVVKTPPNGASSTFAVHRLLQSWGEGSKSGLQGQAASANEATWNHRFATTSGWSSPGGAASTDYAAAASASTSVSSVGSYTFASNAQLVADVQAWVDNPASNFGWLIRSQSESTLFTARRIATREGGADAPKLTIEYNPPAATVLLSGKTVYYEGNKSVPGVTLALSGGKTDSTTSASDGSFTFSVGSGGQYTVTPSKSSDTLPSQGVTTLDIALIRRQILGIEALNAPYKILAGDVNNTGSVTTLDIALIRRLILGIDASYPGGLWKFVRADFQFADPLAPWNFDSTLTTAAVSSNLAGQDFIAIKLGDVNGSWTAPAGALLDQEPK